MDKADSASAIVAKDLRKVFKTKIKKEGFRESVKSIIGPEYKEIEAVRGITLEVPRGELVAFLGPNGAGKSTTIKMLTGILHPTSGNMSVLGFDPQKQRKELSFKIGSVFGQKSQLWFHLPPIDSFRLLGAIYEIDGRTLDSRIKEIVELFEIGELMDTPVRKLSLGQRMRCEFAASILHRPRIVFLDEPTIGLDVLVKQKIRELIVRLNREENTTIFLTSHDIGDVEQLCNRAVIINHGRIVLDSSIKALKYGYLNRKIIDVKFNEFSDRSSLEGLNIIKGNGLAMKLEADESGGIQEVMSRLMRAGSILDVTISDIPMEKIIGDIYRDKDTEDNDIEATSAGEVRGCDCSETEDGGGGS
ncbi:MAG TPA: ATP-binding cassette domain-containing protein [Clostridia bacterium]|nr:ATP-binding cassette domain-containing protein [Clostridia bacterium]